MANTFCSSLGEVIKIVLETFNWASAVGTPALFGFGGLFITAAVFKRPYIAIAGGVLGLLFGIGFIS